MRMLTIMAAVSAAAAVRGDVLPSISPSIVQAGQTAAIQYTISGAPAVVTVELQTNTMADASGEWVPVGGDVVSALEGDVGVVVAAGTHSVTLKAAYRKFGDIGAFAKRMMRAVLTAWPLDNTPDYMVVDLQTSSAQRVKYYASADQLPGGLLANAAYRDTHIVMRKIMAKGVEFQMGSIAEAGYVNSIYEQAHTACLDHNYYIGVFELTEGQYNTLTGVRPSNKYKTYDGWRMCPVNNLPYYGLRESYAGSPSASPECQYPAAPNVDSVVGKMRGRTVCAEFPSGVDFDLPSEAEWEFAARGGYGEARWGDGSCVTNAETDVNLSRIARYKANSGFATMDAADADDGVLGATDCGKYAPNAYGLYDMAGNASEWCLDWYGDYRYLRGGTDAYYGITVSSNTEGTQRVMKGGNYKCPASGCRPAARLSNSSDAGSDNAMNNWNSCDGLRVVCRAGLE